MCTQTNLVPESTSSNNSRSSNLSTEQKESTKIIVHSLLNLNKNVAVTGTQNVILVNPNDSDVLSGRGNGVGLHPGNISFRNFLKQYQDMYLVAGISSGQKRAIVSHILEKVKSSGGRFLKLGKSNSVEGWVAMTFDEARKKTAQALRDGSPMTMKNQLRCNKTQLKNKKLLKCKKELKPKKELKQEAPHFHTPSNMPPSDKACFDGKPSTRMSLQDKINSEMVNTFKMKIDRIRGDMNELKRKYDLLDKEQNELTREFMKNILGGGSYTNEISKISGVIM